MRQSNAVAAGLFELTRFEVVAVSWLYRVRLIVGWPNARAAFAPYVLCARIGLTLLLCACLPALRAVLPYPDTTPPQVVARHIEAAPATVTAAPPPLAPETLPPYLAAPFTATLSATATPEIVPTFTNAPPTALILPTRLPPTATTIIQRVAATIVPSPMRTALPATPTAVPTIRATAPTSLNRLFVVQPGDTLWTIARRIGAPVEQVAALNHLALDSTIYAGQTLVLPVALAAEVAQPTKPPVAVPLTPLAPPTGTVTIPPLGAPASFVWPVRGVITTYYTPPRHPAIDIGVPMGTPILASARGVVTYAAWSDAGYGNFVIVQHANGYVSRYAHLSRYEAQVGQVLAQGQVLGYVGSTGNSTGPHLHFEILYNGSPLDPLVLLGG